MYQIYQSSSWYKLRFVKERCIQKSFIQLFTIAAIGILLGGAPIQPNVAHAAESHSPQLQNGLWPYRAALTVNANGHERTDKIAEISVNFSQLLTQVSETADFDDASIRVVEIDSNDNIINANVPFQFDKHAAYNASSNAVGTLVLQMSGTTPASGDRNYQIYFGTVGQPYILPSFTPLVIATVNGVQDEGEDSYKFEMASGTYYYQHQSGGFSSIDDVDGNDWISHSSAVGSAGEFRGIPNLIHPEGGFHPGDNGSTTQIEHIGPLKVTYLTTDGNWQARWEIYPEYVRMTLLQTDHEYWFLYEGTPGGELTTSDRYALSTGPTQYNAYRDADNVTDLDMPIAEWIYFSDSNVGPVGRSLFLVHHEDDAFPDSYRRLGTTANNNAMAVFGFGRQNLSKFMSQVPQHFTFGLLETVDYTEASTAINASYQDLSISLGAVSIIDEVAPVQLGDVNCDETVDAVDALFILQYTVEMRTDSGSCPSATSGSQLYLDVGDVNEDGSIAAVDALFILQCTVNINNVLCPDTLGTEVGQARR